MSDHRLINGVDRPVAEMSFEIINEPWLEYALADGGRVRVRVVTTGILRVLDEDGHQMVDDKGEPMFIVETNPVHAKLVRS